MPKKKAKPVKEQDRMTVSSLRHSGEKRRYIPTAEYRAVLPESTELPVRVAISRRNRDLDPQLVWRGKDEQDKVDMVSFSQPLYIQEKVHAKALVDELVRHSSGELPDAAIDLFSDFNGIPKDADKTEFYQHEQNWSNRMILGDSLHVMTSLAEKEGLRGKVQCVYFDPPYGVKFNSNFQWSTTNRDVKDGKIEHITREPEQVKAFRDTWKDGIHSYLSYLRDRLLSAAELLHESGSLFIQIGDENVHRVRVLLDEVFGEDNFVCMIAVNKTSGLQSGSSLPQVLDFVVQYAKNKEMYKFRPLYIDKRAETESVSEYFYVLMPDLSTRTLTSAEKNGEERLPEGSLPFRLSDLTKPGPGRKFTFEYSGKQYNPGSRWWGNPPESLERVGKAGRLHARKNDVCFMRLLADFSVKPITNYWRDVAFTSRSEDKTYVVQTAARIVERCILMSTDPGDLVLDPTCGSGTTAFVSEQWGRRWITMDTSRVALALARARIMGAKFPFYLLSDSPEGQAKIAEITRTLPSSHPTNHSLRQGFVYERVPHITLKSIANNAEVDVIWDKWEPSIAKAISGLNKALKSEMKEWEVPKIADTAWSKSAQDAHAKVCDARLSRQREIDESIAARAESEPLYDRPYEDKRTVRVAGPFTVDSLSPHRMLGSNEEGATLDLPVGAGEEVPAQSFTQIILDNLSKAGVQQVLKDDRLAFETVMPWPGKFVCAEANYNEGKAGKRAGIFIGPEFGTVTRPDLVEAAREAADGGFDVLVACAFNFEAHTTEFNKLGRIPVLKARMNADLHMASDLKTTGKGNLFVVFGEPDVELQTNKDGTMQVKVKGVDVFDPSSGEVRSDDTDGIACWMLDTNYNEESFFVRHAYFLGANDPYKSLRSTLKAQIDEDAWETLHSDTSRPFAKPKSKRIAVKIINHLGDEVMKVFKV